MYPPGWAGPPPTSRARQALGRISVCGDTRRPRQDAKPVLSAEGFKRLHCGAKIDVTDGAIVRGVDALWTPANPPPIKDCGGGRASTQSASQLPEIDKNSGQGLQKLGYTPEQMAMG